MNFKAQNVKLPVTNSDKLAWQTGDKKIRHGVLLPDSLRAVLCGLLNGSKSSAPFFL